MARSRGLTAFVLAALLAGPAFAAAPPEVDVDPRIELLSVVHSLASLDKPLRGFAFNGSAYADDAKKRFASFRSHRAVTLYREAAASGLDFVGAFKLMLSTGTAAPASGGKHGKGGPGPGSIMNPGGQGSAPLLEAFKDFEKDSGFTAFFAENRERYEGFAAPLRRELAERDFAGLLEKYTGMPVNTRVRMIVCALCTEPEGANALRPGVVVKSLGPRRILKGEPVFDVLELRLGLWHELAHDQLDGLLAAPASREEMLATAPLYQTVASCCRDSWEACVREHVAQGVAWAVWDWSRRTGLIKEGPKTLKEDKEPPLIRPVLARLDRFEVEREGGVSLAAFHPRLLGAFSDVLKSPAGKGGKNSSCRPNSSL